MLNALATDIGHALDPAAFAEACGCTDADLGTLLSAAVASTRATHPRAAGTRYELATVSVLCRVVPPDLWRRPHCSNRHPIALPGPPQGGPRVFGS
jgi:hypothetical protein